MSTVEGISMEGFKKVESSENIDDEPSNDIPQARAPPIHIIRYSTAALFALRSSKLSQQKPACKNMDLACMIHVKPPPKMLIVNMMPKFLQNQMPNRGEESISPLSFHSNSSSSSNLSYQKQRYQDGNNGSIGDSYSNNRYYYNKYNKNNDDGGSSRIIYKTTGANSSNGNSIRFLKKAYNSKYEEQENSIGLISNKNILDNASRVITAADHRNSKKKLGDGDDIKKKPSDTADDKGSERKQPSDDANNNSENNKDESNKKLTEVNANDLMLRNDLKKHPNDLDMVNHMDDIFNDMNINQLLDENIPDERGSSRFSKWFRTNKDESKDESIFPDTQNNNKNSNLSLFGHETDKFFQPIDKVENNSLFQMMKGHEMDANQRNDPLLNMLKNPPPQQSASAMSPNSGQVHSLEELEAKLRHHNDDKDRKSSDNEKKVLQNFFQQQLMPNLMQQSQRPPQNQEDINAFKKFLSQITNENDKVSGSQLGTAPSNQNLLQQLVNKGFQNNPDVMTQYQKSFPIVGKVPPQVNNQKVINPINPGNHMIQQPFGGNIDLKFLQQQQQQPPQKIPLPEIIKRPEVQALVQELTSGEISQYTLWQRLTAPGLTPIERDIITCALNVFNANSNNGSAGIFPKQPIAPNLFPQTAPIAPTQNKALHQLMQHQIKTNTLAAPIPIPPQTSPLSPVPPLEQHLLYQHQAAVAANKQLRLSPLPAGMPQRIPSPRELQYHTQSIMQNALIRKKLEEQRENFRKRQEQEKHESAKKNQNDPAISGATSSNTEQSSDQQNVVTTTTAPSQDDIIKTSPESPVKKLITSVAQIQAQRQHAPSPNIFTPTSVLRKMTAEKESDSNKSSNNARVDDKKKQAPNMPQQHPLQRNQMQQPFMNNIPPNMKLQNEAFGMNSWPDTHQQQQQQPIQQGIKPPVGRPIVKSSPAQHNTMIGTQNNMNQGGAAIIPPQNPLNFDFQQQQMQKMNQIQKAQFLQQQQQQQMMQMKKQQMDNNPVLSQFMAQQQQRAQAQSQFRSPFQQQQQQQQQINFQSMMQGRTEKNDDLHNRNILNNGGCLSPTSNQLAKWFSPELLADASAGKLLPSLNVGQMMSLEELEKCMQNS